MRILIIKPLEFPEIKEIDGTLESMQKAVGGSIQAIYSFDDPVAIVANDEGKILGLPLNRGLRDNNDMLYDIICGTFFICGLTEDNFGSLTEDQLKKFYNMFQTPELFVRVNGDILALPLMSNEAEKWRKELEG